MNEGDELLVRRSDNDHDHKKWPLFYIQLQRDDFIDVLEEKLGLFQPSVPLSDRELVFHLVKRVLF